MKILVTTTIALVLAAGAASGATRSGLRGVVLIVPASPVCRVGVPCTKPAAHVRLVFRQHGKVVARTRTATNGSYRITLAPGSYGVSSPNHASGRGLTPSRVAVRSGLYRRVAFKLDVGIR